MKHIDNVTKVWGLNAVVAINRFASDTEAEIELVRTECAAHGACAIPCDVWGKGGAGATELAAHVKEMCDSPKPLTFTYDDETPLDKKIAAVAKKVYGAAEVKFAPGVRTKLKQFAEDGLWQCTGVHRQDAVFTVRRYEQAGRARGLHAQCARRASERGRGLRGRVHGRDNRHAGPAQGSRRRKHRR